MIRPIEIVLMQRHDPRCEIRIMRRAAAMEPQHHMGFVDGDDFPNSVDERAVGNTFAFGHRDKCAGSELAPCEACGRPAAAGFSLAWGHGGRNSPPWWSI